MDMIPAIYQVKSRPPPLSCHQETSCQLSPEIHAKDFLRAEHTRWHLHLKDPFQVHTLQIRGTVVNLIWSFEERLEKSQGHSQGWWKRRRHSRGDEEIAEEGWGSSSRCKGVLTEPWQGLRRELACRHVKGGKKCESYEASWGDVCVCVNVCVNEEFIEEDTRSGSGERYLNARLIFFSCSLLAVNISRTFLNRRSLLGNKVPIICPPLKSLLSLLARWKWRLAGAGFLSRSLAQGCVQLGPGWSRLL